MLPATTSNELGAQLERLWQLHDLGLLFGWVHAVLASNVSAVEACLRRDDAGIERAHLDWSEQLAGRRPAPGRPHEEPLDCASLLGLALALAGWFSDADPCGTARVERLPVKVPAGAHPLVAGTRFWILRREQAPLLADLPRNRHLARTNRDISFDLAEELDLRVRLLWEPASLRVRPIRLPAAVDERLRSRGRPDHVRVGLGLINSNLIFSDERRADAPPRRAWLTAKRPWTQSETLPERARSFIAATP